MELFLFIGFLISLALLLPWWMVSRARTFLPNWAEANGYTIASANPRMLWKGPYFLKSSNNQVVFRITVSASLDGVRSGQLAPTPPPPPPKKVQVDLAPSLSGFQNCSVAIVGRPRPFLESDERNATLHATSSVAMEEGWVAVEEGGSQYGTRLATA